MRNVKLSGKSFNFQSNENNPLGIFQKNSSLFQVLGWFTNFNSKELNCDLRGNLPNSNLALQYQLFGTRYSCFGWDSRVETELKNSEQLKHFKLNPSEHFCFNTSYNVIFVFKIYQGDISISDSFTQKPEQAIWDYFSFNNIVPEIMSINRIAEEIARAFSGETKKSNYHKNLMDEKALRNVLHFYSTDNMKNFTAQKKEYNYEKEELDKIKNEPDFNLFSDYKTFSEDIDLIKLHKKIVAQAKINGGFLDFTYKNKTYKIPKLPLLAWAYSDSINKIKYTIHNETWRPISPKHIKTPDDSAYHSDWWIGAGFPIECYNLQTKGINFLPFNNAVSLFAFECIGMNTLEEVTVLSGKLLSDISGKIVINPKNIDDFDEDDIIVLDKGGVEFDLFIKKACKNSKGSVIIEVGNQVSHLSIVARELNYRLILLPNAKKLLKNDTIVNISTKNKKITIL